MTSGPVDLTPHARADLELGAVTAPLSDPVEQLRRQLPAVIATFERIADSEHFTAAQRADARSTARNLTAMLGLMSILVDLVETCHREAAYVRQALETEGDTRH